MDNVKSMKAFRDILAFFYVYARYTLPLFKMTTTAPKASVAPLKLNPQSMKSKELKKGARALLNRIIWSISAHFPSTVAFSQQFQVQITGVQRASVKPKHERALKGACERHLYVLN